MTTLKQLLEDNNISQRTVAANLCISPASVNLIVNQGKYPKTPNAVVLQANLRKLLISYGIAIDDINQALQQTPATDKGELASAETKTNNTTEEDIMLLRKQSLSQQAKRQFGLLANPFTSDVQSADELFKTPDISYVQASLLHTAKHGGFIAVTGESGSGKTTLRRDLIDRLNREGHNVIVIEPYVLATEDNDIKGKTLKAAHIAESILSTLAPLENPKRSPEARFRQVHNLLKESSRAGNTHVLIIEEAHSLPLPTLKHLKRFFELEDGYKKLLGIILIGQDELAQKLSEHNPHIREVVQRCEIVTLNPLNPADIGSYLAQRAKALNLGLDKLIDQSGIDAIADKLTVQTGKKDTPVYSLLYPLAIGNLLTGALNMAADLGVPRVTADVVRGV